MKVRDIPQFLLCYQRRWKFNFVKSFSSMFHTHKTLQLIYAFPPPRNTKIDSIDIAYNLNKNAGHIL